MKTYQYKLISFTKKGEGADSQLEILWPAPSEGWRLVQVVQASREHLEDGWINNHPALIFEREVK